MMMVIFVLVCLIWRGYFGNCCYSTDLADRSHRTVDYFSDHRNDVVPVSLAFYQSEWDESVRHIFHNIFSAFLYYLYF